MTELSKWVAQRIAQSSSRATILAELKERNIPITEVIKIVRAAFGISLGEAKNIVTQHPAWREIARENEALHDALISTLGDKSSR